MIVILPIETTMTPLVVGSIMACKNLGQMFKFYLGSRPYQIITHLMTHYLSHTSKSASIGLMSARRGLECWKVVLPVINGHLGGVN